MDPASSIGPGGNSPKSTTILVVEDEILLRLAVAYEFRAYGYIVVEAASADEALSVLQSGTVVHAVLTDIRMPGSLDGIDFVRRVRAEWPEIIMVVTSGSVPQADLSQIGVAGFFPKPYQAGRIIQLIAAVVDRSRPSVPTPRASA